MFLWCRRPDSNRHTRRRLILNQLRLPIPPLRHEVMCFLENAAIILALCLLATLIREVTVCSIKKKAYSLDLIKSLGKLLLFIYLLMSMLTSPKLFFLSQSSVTGGRSLFLLVYLQSNVNI